MNTLAIGNSIAVHRALHRAPPRLRWLDVVIIVSGLSVAGAGLYAREITRMLTGW